jgi:hypothetical protein
MKIEIVVLKYENYLTKPLALPILTIRTAKIDAHDLYLRGFGKEDRAYGF